MPLFSTAIYAYDWYFYFFQERGVGFQIVLEQQNMPKKLNIFLFAEHAKHENSHNVV
jgi:hypothetical protein